jgi:hypothetical protein
VAVRLPDGTPSDPGPWWILQSGGYRAYPFWSMPLGDIQIPPMPEDLRDLFEVTVAGAVPTTRRETSGRRGGASPRRPPSIDEALDLFTPKP